MQPQQTPNNSNGFNNRPGQDGYGYPPQQNYPQNNQQSPQYPQGQNPQYNQQPQQNYSQPNQQQGPQGQPQVDWYKKPEPNKKDFAPSKASDYVTKANTMPIQQGQLVNGQYSVDYLSDMNGAPQGKVSKKFIAIAAAAIVVTLGIAGTLIAMTAGRSPESPSATLSSVYTIMSDTQDVTKNAGDNIKNSQLKGINSSLDSVLLSTMQSIERPLESSGNKPSSLRSAAKKEPIRDEELREKLEEARLLVMYDRVYLMQVEFKIQEIMRRIEYVHERTGSEETRGMLEKGHTSLGAIKESMDELSESEDSGMM